MGDPLEHPNLTTMGLFAEAYAGLSRTVERRLESGSQLSGQWFEVLLRLVRTPGHRLRMTDLAAQTTLTPSGLTRAVDRLEAAGLVRREACLTDRRSSWATLTDEGEARISCAAPIHVAHLTEILESVFTPAELDELSGLLRKLRDAVHPAGERAGRPAVEAAPTPG